MRSSKKRSRSNQNRPRSLGNIINRVFDSSGPEGKVRGTPQQIIEKYQALARDAQLGNDRVAAENFLQHAEHYTRLLAEAQREMQAEQEARQQQYQQNGNQNGGNRDREYRGDRDRGDFRGDQRPEGRERDAFRDPGSEDQPATAEVMEPAADESGLVETPEARRGDQPQQARPQGDRPQGDRPQGERRERRDREFRRDREDRRRTPEADAQPELPAFITGTAPAVEPAAEPPAEPVAEAAKAAKPRRARKPQAEAPAAIPGDAPEAAE